MFEDIEYLPQNITFILNDCGLVLVVWPYEDNGISESVRVYTDDEQLTYKAW